MDASKVQLALVKLTLVIRPNVSSMLVGLFWGTKNQSTWWWVLVWMPKQSAGGKEARTTGHFIFWYLADRRSTFVPSSLPWSCFVYWCNLVCKVMDRWGGTSSVGTWEQVSGTHWNFTQVSVTHWNFTQVSGKFLKLHSSFRDFLIETSSDSLKLEVKFQWVPETWVKFQWVPETWGQVSGSPWNFTETPHMHRKWAASMEFLLWVAGQKISIGKIWLTW